VLVKPAGQLASQLEAAGDHDMPGGDCPNARAPVHDSRTRVQVDCLSISGTAVAFAQRDCSHTIELSQAGAAAIHPA
jgi:hypothetical protein